MRAFDTDVLTLYTNGDPVVQARMLTVAEGDRYVPIVAAAEVLRGWPSTIRKAEAGRARTGLPGAYGRLETSLREFAGFGLLPFTPAADAQYAAWRAAKIRVGANDLRIAAICHTAGATLVTRSARDYAQVPGLQFIVWP